jgi:hypothetical protein
MPKMPGLRVTKWFFPCRIPALPLLSFFFALPSFLYGAELWLRESLLQQHAQTILITIQARPEKIGKQAHPLKKDCDLHFPLRSVDIRVPILGEIKNACSHPEGVALTTWANKLKPLEGELIEAEGVLRIWLEHPPPGNAIQCECQKVPTYKDSNPPHMVELHPLTRLGETSFLEMTKRITKGDQPYVGFKAGQLAANLGKKTITIRRATKGGETYIVMKSPSIKFNHWSFRARVLDSSEQRPDGHVFEVAVLDGDQVVKDRLRVVTAAGTRADLAAETAQADEIVTLFGIVRLNLPVVESEAGKKWKTIPLPYELVALDVIR